MKPIMPEFDPELSLLDFSSKILDNARELGQEDKLLYAASILMRKPFDEIIVMDKRDFIEQFFGSLLDNRIFEMLIFFDKVGFNA